MSMKWRCRCIFLKPPARNHHPTSAIALIFRTLQFPNWARGATINRQLSREYEVDNTDHVHNIAEYLFKRKELYLQGDVSTRW